MNFQKFLWILFLLLFPSTLFAGVVFVSLFPNTPDDARLEYMEIRNTTCETISLSGYSIEDASGKRYIFSSGAVIESQKNLQIGRVTSKIILNNEDETLFIKNASGQLIDQFSYAKSTKGVVLSIQFMDEMCTKTQTGNQLSSTGNQNTQSGSSSSQTGGNVGVSGEVSIVQTGSMVSSEVSFSGSTISSEVQIPQAENISSPPQTSALQNTGTIHPAFPDISPTLQFPTNAVFSGGYFDCMNLDICRINITFEPIFTGSFLAKNYICEIVTQTGVLDTCNPNTLYFSQEGHFSLRLISKIDTSISSIVSWDVRFSQKKGEIPDTLSGNILLNDTLSGKVETPFIAVFPEIIPTFQNYTNTTFSGDTFTCHTTPCRLNFTLEPMFISPYFLKDFSCQILSGSGIYETCNPPQLYLSGTGNIEVIITEKSSLNEQRKVFSMVQDRAPEIPSLDTNKSSLSGETIDTTPPVALLDHDGKWKEYFYQVSENELDCYSQTCSLNFTAERSYDPDGGKIRFLWIFDTNIISTSRDPGSHTYGMGDHTIILRVIDMAGNYTELRYTLHVLGKKKKEEKTTSKTKKTKGENEEKKLLKIVSSFDKKIEKLEQKLDTKITKELKKKQKKLKFLFFTPPKLLLQGKTGKKISENQYFCITTKNNCKLNFTLSGTYSAYRYEWVFAPKHAFIGKNPKAVSYPLGKHTILLSAYPKNGTTPLWKEEIKIQVVKKAKKVKKKKVKKTSEKKPKKEETQKVVPEVSFQMEKAGTVGVVLFLTGIGGSLFLYRRKNKK